jgi:type II secretory pathway predicted ATPase ExeA/septal ring-binding cell division protein DamX
MTMYLEHFGLREAPFRITPHTEFFFAGANRGATLEALIYAITEGEGLVKVTGEVGTGKTMLCRVLMERLPETVETIYLAVPSLTRDEMLIAISSELGIDTHGANTTQLIRSLQTRLIALHAEGRQIVALIDEAHAMPLATLEEIRLLSNLETGKEKLLQIVLFGQPELDEHLNLPHMRQLKERITHSFGLAPLPPRDIKDYINFRLRAAGYHGPDLFGEEALRIISEASEGLTRRINIYADKTLLAAFAAGTHTVGPDHARAAVADTQIVVASKSNPRRTAVIGVAGLAAGVALGIAAAVFIPQLMAPAPAVATAPPAAPSTSPAPAPAAAPSATPAAPPSAAAPSAASTRPDAASPAQASAPPAQQAAASLPSPSKQAAEPSQAASAAPPPSEPAAAPKARDRAAPRAASSPLLDARYSAGLALLDGATERRYVVQLMMTDARETGYLEYYLAEAARTLSANDLFLYPSGSADSPKVGVLYGSFQTRREATEAMNALPANLRQFRPYVRTVEGVKNDVRRGSAS